MEWRREKDHQAKWYALNIWVIFFIRFIISEIFYLVKENILISTEV